MYYGLAVVVALVVTVQEGKLYNTHTHVARMCVKATHKTIQWFFDESVLHNFACLIVSSVAAPYTLHTLHQSFV